MAETSALCLPTFSSPSPIYRSKETSISSISPALTSIGRFSILGPQLPIRSIRIVAKASDPGNFLGDDPFGFYPWDTSDADGVLQSDGDGLPVYRSLGPSSLREEIGQTSSIQLILCIEWVHEERVTLFTTDGLIQIGGSMVPRRFPASYKKHGKVKTSQRFQRFQEHDYMDPNQGLCLGALFDIAATNGLDMGRRFCIIGFCRSIEMLSDVVEDTVLEHGGEVVAAEKGSRGGLHEKLSMTVAVPLLFGVPPASETLHLAVRSGGGIVDKVFWQWDFL
ncbi:hypothetical protein LguiA_016061 [Lonicera macranthoides]